VMTLSQCLTRQGILSVYAGNKNKE